MLQFDNLSKHYDTRPIFHGLHYTASTGCHALNDDSGTGKSTLLAILAGEIHADQGDVLIDGTALRDAKRRVAYIPDDCLPGSMQTGRAYLDDVASARNTRVGAATLDLAERFGLTPHLDKRFEQMSYGTRKKVLLSAATLGDVTVVIADEPGGGLDAAARVVLGELFQSLGATRTVFFCSYDEALIEACNARAIRFADLAKAV